MDGLVAESRLVAHDLGEPARLSCNNHDAFAGIQSLAAILHKGTQTPTIGIGRGKLRYQVIGPICCPVGEILAARKNASEAQLAQLMQARLQPCPGNRRVAQARRVLALLLKALFDILTLGIQVKDVVLQALRIVQHQQAGFWQIIEHVGLSMQIGQVEGDIIE